MTLKHFTAMLLVASLAACHVSENAALTNEVTSCGWFENATPANASFYDLNGQWTIELMGTSIRAEGDWPDFAKGEWIETNSPYGYGCACLTVQRSQALKRILTITASEAKPASLCRHMPALHEPS